MQDNIRRIKGEIRLRMIDARDYYRDTLESLRGGDHEHGTEVFRGWLEAKMRDAERAIVELTPKTLLSANFTASGPPTVAGPDESQPSITLDVESSAAPIAKSL